MSNLRGYSITDQMITVNYNGKTHFVSRSEALADRLIKALKEGRENEIPDLIDAAKRVSKYTKGNFEVRNGEVFVNGVKAPKFLGDKIWKFSQEGLPSAPLVKFAENLQRNPSFRAVNELFQFLDKNNHPITEEGNFIAYKRVRGNFTDIHTGTFDNSVGNVVEIPRNQVDEDSNRTCSHGLHVANWNYAHVHFASSGRGDDVMLEVEVNPADVVAIPVDYNQSKMRVCKYKVLGVVDKEHSSDVDLRVTNPSYQAPVESYDEEEDEEPSEDEENSCASCGDSIEDGYDYCDDCEDEAYDEEEDEEEDEESEYGDEEEEEDEEEDEDDYPWDDELDT